TEESNSGHVVFIERVLRRKDNTLIKVESTAKLMSSGKVNVLIRNVTDRFLAWNKIEESEEKYRTLVDQAADGIFIVNTSLQFVQVNKMACSMMGYTEDELLRLSPPDLIVFKEGDPPLRIEEVKEKIAVIQERVLRRKDGTTFHVEISATKLINGNILGIVRDIAERKNAERALAESENRLRTILDNEPECVKILNRKGELIDMNPAGLAMIEADSLQGVKGANIISLVDEPYKEDFAELTRNVFKGITGKLEFGITGLKGRRLWMETHAVPFRDAEGKIISLLAVTRDVTDRKNAEEKIKQYTNQLRDLTVHLQYVREEERAALSRELHDELGQQLTAMKMDLSWINKRVDSDQISSKLQEIMHLIHDAVSTLRRINSELRPSLLDDLGLFAALEHQAIEFSDRYSIPCTSRV
ncbi:MAG: PAS domain S-box protein, partial [Cyclobacteriaceae bacterium]